MKWHNFCAMHRGNTIITLFCFVPNHPNIPIPPHSTSIKIYLIFCVCCRFFFAVFSPLFHETIFQIPEKKLWLSHHSPSRLLEDRAKSRKTRCCWLKPRMGKQEKAWGYVESAGPWPELETSQGSLSWYRWFYKLLHRWTNIKERK